MRTLVAVAVVGLAACGGPPDAPPTVTQTTLVVEHDAVGNVASTLDDIRKRAGAAVNYTDSQLLYIADDVCHYGSQGTVDAWAKAGHDVDLLAAIGDAVLANPYYCDQQMDPWGAAS